jgi:hypothetical protein
MSETTQDAARDFARILRATDGRQALYYVEPDGGDYKVHCVASLDGAQADLVACFTSDNADANEFKAFAMLEALTEPLSADRLYGQLEKMMAGGLE